MNRVCAACLLIVLALAGCSSGFRDDTEELAYLEALSNPSPDQWKRRESLRATEAEKKATRDREAYEAGPAVGSTVELPPAVALLDVFDSLESLQTAQSLLRTGKLDSPEYLDNDRHRFTTLGTGATVTILEVGEDHVVFLAHSERSGEAVSARDGYSGTGTAERLYASRWWDPGAEKKAVGMIHSPPQPSPK